MTDNQDNPMSDYEVQETLISFVMHGPTRKAEDLRHDLVRLAEAWKAGRLLPRAEAPTLAAFLADLDEMGSDGPCPPSFHDFLKDHP